MKLRNKIPKKGIVAIGTIILSVLIFGLIAYGMNSYAIDGMDHRGGGGTNLGTANDFLLLRIWDNSTGLEGDASYNHMKDVLKNRFNVSLSSSYDAEILAKARQAMNDHPGKHARVIGLLICSGQPVNGQLHKHNVELSTFQIDHDTSITDVSSGQLKPLTVHPASYGPTSDQLSDAEGWTDQLRQEATQHAITAAQENANPYVSFAVVVAWDGWGPSSGYKLSVSTQQQSPANMTYLSKDPVKDHIVTTVTEGSVTGAANVTGTVTLHFGGFGTRAACSADKQFSVAPGGAIDSDPFTPSDLFGGGDTQSWAQGEYWFTVKIDKQDKLKENVNLSDKVDAESFKVGEIAAPHSDKILYDETDKREVDIYTEHLVYDMTYIAQVSAYSHGSSDLWIEDVINTENVEVDNDKAFVTKTDSDTKAVTTVQADITTTKSNGQTITIAHISNIGKNSDWYTVHIPQKPSAKNKEVWSIEDTGYWKIMPDDTWNKIVTLKLPVDPPKPDKVWVINEDGALTATDKDWTNQISDVENGHADEKTFLVGDTIGAAVNGLIRKNLVDPLKSYSITDDVSGSSQYIDWEVSKTKVYIDMNGDGAFTSDEDKTAEFTVKRDGDKIVATAKDSLLKTTGVAQDFGKKDHKTKLYISGTIKGYSDKAGETVKLINAAIENVNGQEADSNKPYVYVWQPNPDKAWIKQNADGTWDAVIDPTKSNAAKDKDGKVSGDDQTFLDGDAVGSVVNGQIPANLAEAPSKLVLYDDWSASDYLVDPDPVSEVRIYTVDVDDTSKSTVTDIANNPNKTDVTKYFTISYNNSDPNKATKATATAKSEYLSQLVNLKKGKQITMLIPMKTDYANADGKGSVQVRKDYGKKPGEEVVMTNAADGSKFSNVAGEIIGGSDVKTNVPWIHGYVPPVTKDVLDAADEGGDQASIDGDKVEPGDRLEYQLTTQPKFPADLSYDIKDVKIIDQYDELFTVDKQTVEVRDLNTGNTIPRSKYQVKWDTLGDKAAKNAFTIIITDANLLKDWKSNGAPRLQTRFEGNVAKEDQIPESRKEADGSTAVIKNNWWLQINNGNWDESNIVKNPVPTPKPEKADKQSSTQGDSSIDINGKTFLMGDTGEYHITLDASEYAAYKSGDDKTSTNAYLIYRLGIVDDYDDEYLDADASKVKVIEQDSSKPATQQQDVTNKFNIQIKDGVLYVFAKLVDTTIPNTQETIKVSSQPSDLKAYSENTTHDRNTEPAIDQSLLGKKYSVILPYTVKKVTKGYVVKNQATQITDNRKAITNIVTNPLEPINPTKDVTITVGGDSVDGQEIALNSYFNYELNSSVIPANRAYPEVTAWSITDSLDEKYDKFTGQWVVLAKNDVYGTDGKVLFKAGDVIAESALYHAMNNKASSASSASSNDTDASSNMNSNTNTSSSAAQNGNANSNANSNTSANSNTKTNTNSNTNANSNTAKAVHAAQAAATNANSNANANANSNTNAAASNINTNSNSNASSTSSKSSDSKSGDKTVDADTAVMSETATMDDKIKAYGDNPYFTATYSNGTYTVSATDAFLKLVSADTAHEYAYQAYIQCERTWVTDRHENVFTETFNKVKTDSNVVWTKTPENPSITIEKYDTASGLKDGDRNSQDDALTVTGDTEIGFLITNNGDVPLTDVNLTDKTVDGTGEVKDITFPDGWDGTLDPGESVTAIGTLSGVEQGTTHTDTATVTGKSYYTGKEVTASDDWNGLAEKIVQTGDTSSTIATLSIVGGILAAGVYVASKRRAA